MNITELRKRLYDDFYNNDKVPMSKTSYDAFVEVLDHTSNETYAWTIILGAFDDLIKSGYSLNYNEVHLLAKGEERIYYRGGSESNGRRMLGQHNKVYKNGKRKNLK